MTTFIPLRTVAQMLHAGGSTMFGKGIRARDVMARFHDLTDHQRANVANWCIRQGADPVPTLYPTKSRRVCDCTDPGCPSCHGRCSQDSVVTVYRVDMDDSVGTAMCLDCARDGVESGLVYACDIADVPALYAHCTA